MKKMFLALGLLLVSVCPASVFAQDIGVAWSGTSGMTKRVMAGFEQGMQELAPGVKIEVKAELESIDDLAAVAERYQKEKAAMLVLRSNGAEWLATHAPSIPTFIGGCSHPGELGAVKNLNAPEGNITGVTYYLPVAAQFEVFQAILPDLKSVLLLVEKGHPSAAIDQEGTKEACAALGIAYTEKLCETKEDVLAAVQEAQGQVSAIVIGNQAVVFDATKSIVAAAGQTPVLAYSAKPVKDGALGGFAADDKKLGYMLAESVVDVLINGKKIVNVPVKIDTDPGFYVNTVTAEKLGIEIPYSILESATLVQ